MTAHFTNRLPHRILGIFINNILYRKAMINYLRHNVTLETMGVETSKVVLYKVVIRPIVLRIVALRATMLFPHTEMQGNQVMDML